MLGNRQLEWCRQFLRHNGVAIFYVMERTASTRVKK